MTANTNLLEYFRVGEPAAGLKGKVDDLGVEYSKAGELFNWLVVASTTIVVSTDIMLPMGMLGTGRV